MSSSPNRTADGALDLGPTDLDIVDPDSYLNGFPHGTFKRLRDEDPISWWPEHDGGKGFVLGAEVPVEAAAARCQAGRVFQVGDRRALDAPGGEGLQRAGLPGVLR